VTKNSDNEGGGYKKPPKEHQFPPGKSGNPKGRPKGSKSTYGYLNQILDQKVPIEVDGKIVKLPKRVVIMLQFANKAAKGDVRAITKILPHMLMADAKEEDKDKIFTALNPEFQKMLIKRMKELSDFDGVDEV